MQHHSRFALPSRRPAGRARQLDHRARRFEMLEDRLFLFAAASVNELPVVTSVQLSSTDWTPSFLEALQTAGQGSGGFAVPVGSDAQLIDLPWINVNQIQIGFNKDVLVDQSNLQLAGVNLPEYSFSGFEYDSTTFTATWTLSTPLRRDNLLMDLDGHSATGVRDVDDNLLDGEWTVANSTFPSGDGAAGGDFVFAFNVLPANANVDTAVNGLDISLVATQWLQTGLHAADVNGDGIVNGLDVAAIASHWLTSLSPVAFQMPTTTTLSASSLAVLSGETIDVTATVSSVAPYTLTPSEGTVTFFDGGVPLGIVAVVGGSATLSGVDLSVGSHAITAAYSDSQGNFGASSTALGSNSIISTVAGSGTQGYSGDDGPATDAAFDGPQTVVADPAGNLFIADEFNNVIRRVDYVTRQVTTYAGTGAAGYGGDGADKLSAQFNMPTALTMDAAGNLYVADQGNNVVRRIDGLTGTIETIAGTGILGYSGDNGPATAAMLAFPRGVAVDADGNVYISDSNNNVVRKVDSITGLITTIAGNGLPGYGGDNGPATVANLFSPQAIVVDGAGHLYIADRLNARVRLVDLGSGNITTFAGTGVGGYAGDNGLAIDAKLNHPSGLALDNAGNVLIADAQNNAIRQVNIATGIITTIAGTGTFGYSGDQGLATAAMLDRASGVTVNTVGDVLIADFRNDVVRQITSGGIIVTVSAAAGASAAAAQGAAPAVMAGIVVLAPVASLPALDNVVVAAALNQAAAPGKPSSIAVDLAMAEGVDEQDFDLGLTL